MSDAETTGAGQAPRETVEGSVERVTFHSEESGYCVLRVKVRGRRELATLVGRLPQVTAGEWVKARGGWVMDKEHGLQFRADALETTPPDSIEGIEKFLGSGMIKGIGPVYAGKLVARFAKQVFDVIDKQSALLETVDGIGPVRRQRIKDGWQEAKSVRAIMTFLMGNGVSTARAFRIYKTYGENAIQCVRADPYCLARDIWGIGFQTADKVAERLGIEKTSDLRARAGIEYVLQETQADGHCAFPRDALLAKAAEILEIPLEIVQTALDHGLAERRMVLDPGDAELGPLVYLTPLFNAEVTLAAALLELTDGAHPCPPIDIAKATAWVEEQTKLTLAPAQRAALAMAVRSKVMVITGGPGVGKTTLVNAILRVLAAKKLRVVLAAPTGRAAKRLTETTGREAKTLHRLLIYDPRSGAFRHNRGNPLEGDVFVVDECSMLDLPLACHLIRAVPSYAALLLVGDVDQLPSVGPGTVLHDLIASDRLPVCRLTEVFRQVASSAIISNAHRVNDGQMPLTGQAGKPSDFYFIPEDDADRAAERLVALVRDQIPKKFGFNPREDIQVLTPMQRGVLGARNLNQRLQAALNGSGEGVERFGVAFRVGDRVMQTHNNYDKEVFNGDLGQIVKLRRDDRELVVSYGERDVPYDFEELDELTLAYAVTIHKSQGSEYPCVVMPLHTQHYMLLQRNLLYTGITRGRKLVVLIGSLKAVAMAVNRLDTRQRITRLAERLHSGQPGQPVRMGGPSSVFSA